MNPLEHYENNAQAAIDDLARVLRAASHDLLDVAQKIGAGCRPSTHLIRAIVADIEQHCLSAEKARAASEAVTLALGAGPGVGGEG